LENAGGGARPVREALFERWREGKTADFAPQQVRPSSRNAWPASPLAVARDSEGSMQAWQVLARAGLGDGDAAAPQAAAPRPLGSAADVAAARGCPHSAPGRAPFSPRQSPFGELCVSALHLAPTAARGQFLKRRATS